MGVFLHSAVFLDCKEDAARRAIEKAAADPDMNLQPEGCFFKSDARGVSALLSDMCCGYEPLAKLLSEETQKPVMLLYIYDDDFWGYYFYENGRELDSYSAWPDALEEIPEEEYQRLAGRAEVVAPYFGIDPVSIERYLTIWNEETMDDDPEPAYPDDEYAPLDCWQMCDFMKKLGFPYGWE